MKTDKEREQEEAYTKKYLGYDYDPREYYKPTKEEVEEARSKLTQYPPKSPRQTYEDYFKKHSLMSKFKAYNMSALNFYRTLPKIIKPKTTRKPGRPKKYIQKSRKELRDELSTRKYKSNEFDPNKNYTINDLKFLNDEYDRYDDMISKKSFYDKPEDEVELILQLQEDIKNNIDRLNLSKGIIPERKPKKIKDISSSNDINMSIKKNQKKIRDFNLKLMREYYPIFGKLMAENRISPDQNNKLLEPFNQTDDEDNELPADEDKIMKLLSLYTKGYESEPEPKKPKKPKLEDGRYDVVKAQVTTKKKGTKYDFTSKAKFNEALPKKVVTAGISELKDKLDELKELLKNYKK